MSSQLIHSQLKYIFFLFQYANYKEIIIKKKYHKSMKKKYNLIECTLNIDLVKRKFNFFGKSITTFFIFVIPEYKIKRTLKVNTGYIEKFVK